MRACSAKLITALLFSLILLPATATAQEAPLQQGATQQLKVTLDSILNILLDPTLQKEENKAQRMETVSCLFRQRFAEQTFCKRALGRHWKERSAEEQAEFTKLFSNLLVETYLDRIDGYLGGKKSFSKENIIYLGERATKKYTLVTTDVKIDEKTTIPVLYRMENIDNDWKVADIAIEGISLLKNYRAQFNEIIANGGYTELLNRLKGKQI